MLDDLKYIHQKDVQDALGIAERQWQQLAHTFDMVPIQKTCQNIVYAGMGGSALAALLSTTWPGYSLPFEVCRQYQLPAYVGPETLVIAASYSGNTEETINALDEAAAKQAQIVVIAGGGKLIDIAKDRGYQYYILPQAAQPRFAVFYNFKVLITILEEYHLLDTAEADAELTVTAEFLKAEVTAWLPTVPTAGNPAKQLALEVIGKSAIIYAGPLMASAAYKWKISFNENAKNVAWVGVLPEFNHNEFIGWSSHPPEKPYAVIDLRSSFEHERVQKRFEVSERLLSGMRPAPHVVQARGESRLQQLLWLTTFGDFVTLYTALLNGLNPTPVDLVEKFKKALV